MLKQMSGLNLDELRGKVGVRVQEGRPVAVGLDGAADVIDGLDVVEVGERIRRHSVRQRLPFVLDVRYDRDPPFLAGAERRLAAPNRFFGSAHVCLLMDVERMVSI